jgi:hypothetical protein
VTVGKLDRAGRANGVTDGAGRTMPTAIEDCALQRAEGGEEQGGGQVVWQVLVYCYRNIMFLHAV